MMVTYRIMFILYILLPITISAQCTLSPDSENVVGTQLAGDWQINGDLSTQLWPDYMTGIGVTTISFTDNPSIVNMVPEEDCRWINDLGLQLFMAGEFSYPTEQGLEIFPFVLSSISGNPKIFFWREEGERESFNLMIARAEDKNKDLLFIAVDEHQPFIAWSRIEI